MEAPSRYSGPDALARVIAAGAARAQAGEDPAAVAAAVWPDFRMAVALAMVEVRGFEAAGVREWQGARHASSEPNSSTGGGQ